MYYAAVLSGDKNLQKVFSSGGDFHSTIAKMVFNLPCEVEDVKKQYGAMRQSAKAISFGILYGSGANKVSQTVTKATGEEYPVEQARDDIKQYFSRFSKLKPNCCVAAEKAWGIGMKRACVSRQGGGGAEGEVLVWRLKARRKLVKKRPASTWSHSALPRARYLTSRSLD